MTQFEFIKTTREIIGEIEDRYDIETKKTIISKDEAIEFLKEKNVFCGVGAVTQNKGHRINFTLNKKYVVEVWDKKIEEIKIFDDFDEVLSFLEGSYSEKNKITIKLEIMPRGYGETTRKYNYNIGRDY
tara:strand:- start:1474 stop:1860 length:387 start_codon:yes stop_codon:yes gene_type:complete